MCFPNVITDFVSTSTAKKIFQISHSQNLRKSVSGDQNVHMDSIFEKNYHKLIDVSHGANSKCAESLGADASKSLRNVQI